ncbi:MAG: OmpA family protein [Gammaproteobacteria bacterium]
MQNLSKQKVIVSVLVTSLLCLTGCSSINPYSGETQMSDSTKGAGIGTVGGALIGAIAGGGRGALIGGVIGGLAGGVIGHTLDQENQELRATLVGTGVQVRKVGNSIQLIMASDITFDTNQADVRSGFYPTLNSVAIVLKKYDNNSITITGYTDNVGGDAYNQVLSERRAHSVGDYLMAQGISGNHIFAEGFGKRNPIASNASAEGRSMNRRVVITLRPLS